jgi:hypothetical protein
VTVELSSCEAGGTGLGRSAGGADSSTGSGATAAGSGLVGLAVAFAACDFAGFGSGLAGWMGLTALVGLAGWGAATGVGGAVGAGATATRGSGTATG